MPNELKVCNYQQCGDDGEFLVTDREGDAFLACKGHLTPVAVVMANHAPLTVEPIFAAWKSDQPREQAVTCRVCFNRKTWAQDAICGQCRKRA